LEETSQNERIARIELKVDSLVEKVASICGQNGMATMLVRWVIFPLVSIMGVTFGAEKIIARIVGG